MSCTKCGGDNTIGHLNGMCTTCGQEYTRHLMQTPYRSDEERRRWGDEPYKKPQEIRIFGIKVGEIK